MLNNRTTRHQGAIIHEHRLLLIRTQHNDGRSYWVIPGGGIEEGESEAECVRREMREETRLDVQVVRLLLDEANEPGFLSKRLKTYLCEKR